VLGVAARRPDLVRAAAVHEPPLLAVVERDPALAPLAAGARADLERVGALIRAGDVDGGLRFFAEEVALGPGAWDQLPEGLRRSMAANQRTFLDMLDDPAWAELDLATLRRVDVPIQLSVGDESPRWLLTVASVVQAELPGVTNALYQGAGHIPQITHADEYVDRVTAFLAAR
jgi:pimeloyl-ACP methyl ester carboxylesterase